MAYQFEHTWEKERERLRAIERGDGATIDALLALGVAEGWRCLEVGAGAGSIARWLCERVGASGHVVATDLEVRFLGEIEAGNLEVRRHDILVDPLEEGAYDLAHARKVLEHLPQHDLALRRMLASLRRGGWICVEDADLLRISTSSAQIPLASSAVIRPFSPRCRVRAISRGSVSNSLRSCARSE